MTKAEILGDLEYVRAMAEEGRNAPFIGGRIGIWWGVLLCITLFFHWLVLTGKTGLSEVLIGLAWMCFGIVGTIGSIVLGRTLRSKPGGTSANNRVAAAIWQGSAFFLLTFGFAAGISAGLGFIDHSIMNIMMPVAFGVYGLSTFVTSKVSGEKWLILPSLLGFAVMTASLFILTSPHLCLLSIVGVIGTIIIPGFIQLRREPSDVI